MEERKNEQAGSVQLDFPLSRRRLQFSYALSSGTGVKTMATSGENFLPEQENIE
jgi:hypothetical protein